MWINRFLCLRRQRWQSTDSQPELHVFASTATQAEAKQWRYWWPIPASRRTALSAGGGNILPECSWQLGVDISVSVLHRLVFNNPPTTEWTTSIGKRSTMILVIIFEVKGSLFHWIAILFCLISKSTISFSESPLSYFLFPFRETSSDCVPNSIQLCQQ